MKDRYNQLRRGRIGFQLEAAPTYYRRLAASLHQTTKKLTTWTAKVRDLRWREYGMDWLRNRGLPTKRCTDSNAYEIEREVTLKGRGNYTNKEMGPY